MSELTIKIEGPSRKQLAIAAGGVLLSIGLAAAAITYIHEYTAFTGLPKNSYKDLSFPVYFPKHPPSGFKLNPKTISSNQNVLTYAFEYQGDNPVYISIQPLDPKLDINSFKPTREITPSIGKGYLVEYDTRTTVAIVTSKSLVLINAPDHVPSYAIEQLADDFQPIK